MKCKCPACGAQLSLDVLMQHEAASEAVLTALSVSGEFGKALIGYLGLFRPAKTALQMDRVATLINELLPDVQSGKICRNGQVYQAPIESWIYALKSAVGQRHTLKLPLKSHGYLYEIIAGYQPKSAVVVTANMMVTTMTKPTQTRSKTAQALQNLADFANE